MTSEKDINDPELPRRRKIPNRLDTSGTENYTFPDVQSYYRQYYFEALDLIINCITTRFDQEGYRAYCKLESLLLKSIKKEDFTEELDFIVKFYQEDFQAEMLHMQLNILALNYPPDAGNDVHSIIKFLRLSSISQRELISQVCSLVSHILVMPATNAISERSFSSLWRVKSYLRSTMSESRLNNLMMLHIHEERYLLLA